VCGLVAVGLLALACGGGDGERVRVLAASSMTDVLPLIAERYGEAHPEVDIEFIFAGSTTLATQIEEGLPADIYIAANRTQAQRVLSAGLGVEGTAIAENTLVIAVAEDAPWRSVEQLAAAAPRVAVAAPGVPAAVLMEVALQMLDPAVAGPLRDGIVTRDPNVRVALSRVETGEADAAFVYSTDLATASGVRAIALPPQLPRNEYIALLVTNDGDPPSAAAAAFLAFLQGDAATEVLVDAGFIPVAVTQ
jgi:molybdate transport system substrate-binding protein